MFCAVVWSIAPCAGVFGSVEPLVGSLEPMPMSHPEIFKF